MHSFAVGFVVLLAASAAAQQISEPQINAGNTVTFRYAAPFATRVALAVEGTRTPIPMDKSDAGLWTVTLPVLAPEIYYYHFDVDGRSTLDPHNFQIVSATNAVANSFLVPGATPQPWETAAIPHGTVHRHTYTTKIATHYPGGQSEFYVYTPPNYDPRTATNYPVLYLLHGWSHVAADWSGFGRANEILDAEIASGKAHPMIVVMPTGYGDMTFVQSFQVWNNPAAVTRNTSLFASALLTEVLPQVERLYHVSARREDRAIAGLSMGGLESLTVGLDHPELFAWVGGMSAAVHLVDPAATARLDPAKANLRLLWIACGTADDLIGPNRKLAASLKAAGFKVDTVETLNGMHTWTVWRENLAALTPLLFQPK